MCTVSGVKKKIPVKILFWDTTGLWVCSKRLERGCFYWPESRDTQGKVLLSHEEFAMLLGGIDLERAQRRQWYRKATGEEPQETRSTA